MCRVRKTRSKVNMGVEPYESINLDNIDQAIGDGILILASCKRSLPTAYLVLLFLWTNSECVTSFPP